MLYYICYGVAFIGFALIIMAIIAFVMVTFGSKKTRSRKKDKLGFKGWGIGINVETNSIFFSMVLGLVIVGTSIAIIKGKLADRLVDELIIEEIISPPTKSQHRDFTILKEEITINLQDRKEVNRFAKPSCTTRSLKIKIKDVENDVEEANFYYGTSIRYIAPILPGDAMWRKIQDESKEVVNPFTDLLKIEGRKDILKASFKDLLSRKGKMKTYCMTIPLTHGKDQEISYTLLYFNAFQGKDFEWASEICAADTDTIVMRIFFPRDKLFKTYKTYKGFHNAEITEIKNPEINTDRESITWNIKGAKKGERYFIKWDW